MDFVHISTNGRGTKAILRALPTAKTRTHLDTGLRELLEIAKLSINLGLTTLGKNTDEFITSYNAAVIEHGERAYGKVLSEIEQCPGANFPRLYKVFSNEILTGLEKIETGSETL